MKTGVPGLLAALALIGPAVAAAPSGVVIEVDAGRHDRRDTPIVFPLPEGLKEVSLFTLEGLDDRKAVPGQLTGGPDPKVVWILRDPLPAGASRRYRLAPAAADAKGPVIGKGVAAGAGSGGGVAFKDDGKSVSFDLDGRTVLKYHTAVVVPPKEVDPLYSRSGFIHPLTTRSGAVVTDDFSPDHAHQHALFFAWVNTTFDGRRVDFWNQQGKTGRVGHESGLEATGGPVAGELRARLRHDDLTAPGGPEPALREGWTVRVYDVPGCVLLDFESVLQCAGPKPLKINKHIYGGLGLRGNRRWRDPDAKGDQFPDPAKSGKSEFLTSEGKHRDGNHTSPRWVDLSGEVDGRVAGVTILDDPGNFRFPQPVRIHPNMPYFCFAPMVHEGFEITPRRPYTSRYRLFVHDGPPDTKAIERLWDDYADPPRVRVVGDAR